MQKNNQNQYTIKEIIEIFTDIDWKLTALNKCSAEDFMTLNSYLRNYYKQAQIISNNAAEIFNTIGGKKQTDYIAKLESLRQSFITHINIFEEQVDIVIESLDKMMSNFNLMFIPLKNFNQNAMTLYFLITNLKLNLNYIDTNTGNLIEEDVKNINRTLIDLKSYFVKLDDDLSKIKNTIRFTAGKLRELKEKNAANVENIFYYFSTCTHLLNQKSEEVSIKLPDLKQKTSNYLESINKIITNLQYQDIIRQKMEHVQAAHRDIVNDLLKLENNQETDDSIEIERNKRFIKIRDVAGLQVAQLIHTNREYQNAIEIITKKFLEVGEEISSVSKLCFQFTGHVHSTDETHFIEVERKLNAANQLICNLIKTNQEFSEETKNIHLAIENLTPFFKSLVLIEVMLNNTASKTIRNTEKIVGHDVDLSGILTQIKELTEYIETNSNQIQDYFSDTVKLGKEAGKKILSYSTENMVTKVFENINKELSAVIDSVVENNEYVNKNLKENSILGNTIANEIKQSIEQVKYYDFFEKIIEEIISKLNDIYTKLHFINLTLPGSAKGENLKSLEKNYTMQTERIIHTQIEKTSEVSPQNVVIQDENQDNIELF